MIIKATSKKQRWFRREILERFMSEDELDLFQEKYQSHTIPEIGRRNLWNTSKID